MTNQPRWTPEQLLQTSGYYWQTCTLHAAVKLDLFSIIGDGRLSGNEIARRAESCEDATCRLLDALAAMELLEKDEKGYANTPESAAFLVRASADYLGHMIMHHHHLMDAWRRLDQSVQTGEPSLDSALFADESAREAFLMGMFTNARLMAPEVAGRLDLSKRKRLLDLGGGPGTYAVFFCRQYPDLSATVFDLPESRPFAEQVVNDYGMQSRVNFQAGDYLKDPLPSPFDAVWISHILHAEGPENCRQILNKSYDCLEEGGMVLVHDFILDENRTNPLFPALFSLNMLVATSLGRAYTEGEISDMLTETGFHDIERHPYRGTTGSGIITGVK